MVRSVDAYEIEVKGFQLGKTVLSKLPDPVYLAAEAPYRYRLRLRDYRKAVPGNESAIRLVAEVDGELYHSMGIYLGLF